MDDGNQEKDVGYFRLSDRDVTDYERIFGFQAEELKRGSRVLDLGSGTNQDFARSLEQQRPDIKVTSLDPTLFLSKYDINKEGIPRATTVDERGYRRKNKYGEVVVAIFPETPHLPFKNQIFDYIFDNHGPLMYFEDDFALLKSYVNEIMRVLKPQGTVYIYPLDLMADLLSVDMLSENKDEEIYLKSENRILAIMGQLGTETAEYQLFDFTEGTPQHLLIRKGIKITKKKA